MWSVLSLVAILVSPQIQGKLTYELKQELIKASPGQKVSCIVIMKEPYPYREMEFYPVKERIRTYQQVAQQSQRPLIEWLSTRAEDAQIKGQFWVMNCIVLEAKPSVILDIAQREDVAWISHNGEVHIIAEPDNTNAPVDRAYIWNIRRIMADSCWVAGFTGQNIIIGETDTGVDYTHPVLQGKWTGYWKVADGLPPSTTPYDDHGHGTHCMGTILGGDGPGSMPDSMDVGVAPGAKFVAAKVLNSGGSGSYDQCLQGLQFMADLKDSVDIKAVSNSWGGSNAADTFFYPVMRTYKSIDILPVFANGNSGPNPNTVLCPGSYSNVLGVGATTPDDTAASFSSRGPAPNQSPFNDPSTWFRSDWNLTKPQISAPGTQIRSCLPNNGWGSWQGTSMATPHVAGAVAILCSKNPTLTPTQLYNILLDNVDRLSGVTYPNNTYGWGRLNVWKSLQNTPTVNQPWLMIINYAITDPPPGGNGNGRVDPGETARMTITIKNVGGVMGYNCTGILNSFDNYITVTNSTHNFGNLASQAEASNSSNPFVFSAHNLTPEGHIASIGVVLSASGGSNPDFIDTVFYSIQIGIPPAPYAIYEDDFEYGSGIDSFLNYWDKTGNWNWSTTQSHSPTHSAYSGTVSNTIMTLTLKNSINLTPFINPRLNFWHKYRFEQGIFLDSAVISISTNGGTTWQRLWKYDWLTGDTIPWKEENLSLGSYISNNVKIRFAVDAYTFFNDYADWWIDDFKITVPTDNEPPYFTNTTRWTDTSFTGPFPVQSIITDASGVDSAYLYYRINSGAWQRLIMAHQGSNNYSATIPSQPLYTTVHYYLWARDKWITPNSGCDPVGAPQDGYYSFLVRPIGVVEEMNIYEPPSFIVFSSNPLRGPLNMAFNLPVAGEVRLQIFDILGRSIKVLARSNMDAGRYEVIWSGRDENGRMVADGVYFLKFSAGDYVQLKKIVLVR